MEQQSKLSIEDEVSLILRKICGFLCFADLAVWLGTSIYFSFLAANELFANLPEDAAGQAVGVLFPTFFLFTTLLSIVGAILYWGLGRLCLLVSRSYRVGLFSVALGALLNLVNLIVLLPMVQSVERKMGPFSTAPDRLKGQFWMLHGSSMLLELISIVCVAIVWLAITLNVEFNQNARR